jgi:aldose 1-epimerase
MPLITLQHDRLRLAINPGLGAGIADFSILGPSKLHYPLMRRAAPDEANPSALASFLLAPYSNRVEHAAFNFRGVRHQLRPTTPEGFSIHGDVRHRPFEILDRTPYSARLRFESPRSENVNWPFAFACEVRYELAPDALDIDLNVHNLDQRPFPAGCGHHPYFPRRLFHDQDRLHLCAPVRTRYPLQRGLPTGEPSTTDPLIAQLARLSPVAPGHFDGIFGGFAGKAELFWDRSRVRMTFDCSPNLGHLVLFTPHADAATDSPLPFIAVEPVTHVNNAFNLLDAGRTDTGLVILEPGQALYTSFRIGVRAE